MLNDAAKALGESVGQMSVASRNAPEKLGGHAKVPPSKVLILFGGADGRAFRTRQGPSERSSRRRTT
jgi:hypothetical protein